MDAAIRVGVSQGGEQLAAERIRERVALLGTIEGEPPHRGTRVVDHHKGFSYTAFGNTALGHGRGAYREGASTFTGPQWTPR